MASRRCDQEESVNLWEFLDLAVPHHRIVARFKRGMEEYRGQFQKEVQVGGVPFHRRSTSPGNPPPNSVMGNTSQKPAQKTVPAARLIAERIGNQLRSMYKWDKVYMYVESGLQV